MAITTREGRTQSSLAEINMVPFIDIVLVLLIIFMITAPVIQSAIQVEVPETEYLQEIVDQQNVVSIDSELRLYWKDEPVSIDDLVVRVSEAVATGSDNTVYLRSDESVPFGAIAAVLDRLSQAGVRYVAVATRFVAPGGQ
jgi:biopolymer transport protein ExbD/biopolymer transport protein TolR